VTADQFDLASLSAQDFVKALQGLAGFLDKRDALRNYQQALDDFAASVKENGRNFDIATDKGRKNQAALDAIANSAIQVATHLHGLDRVKTLTQAAGDIRALAKELGIPPRLVQVVIDKLKEAAHTDAHPKVKVEGTEESNRKIDGVDKNFKGLDALMGGPTLKADDKASGPISWVANALHNLDGDVATVTVKTVRTTINQVMNDITPGFGNFWTGGFTGPGAKYEPRGVVHAGEVVIPQEYVARDWSMLKARYGDLPGFAGGGVVDDKKHPATWFRNGGIDANSQLYGIDKAFLSIHELGERLSNLSTKQLRHLSDDFDNLGKRGVAKLSKALDVTAGQVQKDYDDQREALTTARDALHELRDAAKAFSDSVAGNFTGDTWYQANDAIGFSEADALKLSLTNQAASAKAYLQNLKTATNKGLSGGLFNFLAQSGNSQLVDQFAAMGKADIRQYEQLFAQRNQAASSLGSFASDERYGARLDRAERIADRQAQLTQEMRNELREVKQQIKDFNHRGPERTGKAVGEAVNSTIKRGGVKV
jgi:hypothetical protein